MPSSVNEKWAICFLCFGVCSECVGNCAIAAVFPDCWFYAWWRMIINVLNTWCVLFRRKTLLQQNYRDVTHIPGMSKFYFKWTFPKKYILILLKNNFIIKVNWIYLTQIANYPSDCCDILKQFGDNALCWPLLLFILRSDMILILLWLVSSVLHHFNFMIKFSIQLYGKFHFEI